MAIPGSTLIQIRPMQRGDLGDADRLQRLCYPSFLRDSPAAFASRLDIPGHCCMVATVDGILRGYILAHPWPSMAPPAPDTILTASEDDGLVHYIHDLSVNPDARTSGLGRRLVGMSQAMAWRLGMARSELIAIGGAAPYWAAQGYAMSQVHHKLALKLQSYGPDACYMARELPEPKGDLA